MRFAVAAVLACASGLATEATHAQAESAIPAGSATLSRCSESLVCDSATVDILRRARDVTVRFQSRREAIIAGYRRIGPDFPGMGEHWIHLGNLMSGFDPERPTFLSYAEIEGSTTLVGLAYAVPLGERDAPPEWPGHADVWHDHIGSIEDEVLLTQAGAHVSDARPRARLAMLHAWVWLDNPHGVFAKENWTLPFVRLGLEAPSEPSIPAARALSLVTHRAYYETMIERLDVLTHAEREHVRRVIADHASQVEISVRQRQASGEGQVDIGVLEQHWFDLLSAAECNVTPDASAALARVLGKKELAGHAHPN